MVCIYCSGETDVVNSRAQKQSNQVWRRRRCVDCAALMTTHEKVALNKAVVVTDGNRVTSFEPSKLLISIYKSCQHRSNPSSDAAALTDTCVSQIQRLVKNGSVTLSEIREVTESVLKNFDGAAAVHYGAFHKN